MATQNATITSSWSKIADSADSTILVQASSYIEWQIATMSTESAPSVAGHTIGGRDRAINRDLIGDGHVYARLTAAHRHRLHRDAELTMFRVFEPFNRFEAFAVGGFGFGSLLKRIQALFSSSDGVWIEFGDASQLNELYDQSGDVPAIGDPVGYVADQSGNGNHANQAVSNSRPTYGETVDGTRYVEFDLLDDDLLFTPSAISDANWIMATPYGTQISRLPVEAIEQPVPQSRELVGFQILEPLTEEQRQTVLDYWASKGAGEEVGAVWTTNDTTIFHDYTTTNGPYEIKYFGANGVTTSSTSVDATVDVAAAGLTAPIVVVVPKALMSDDGLSRWNSSTNNHATTILARCQISVDW